MSPILALTLIAVCAVAYATLAVIGFRLLRHAGSAPRWYGWVGRILIALLLLVLPFAFVFLMLLSGNLLGIANSQALESTLYLAVIALGYLPGSMLSVSYTYKMHKALQKRATAKDLRRADKHNAALFWLGLIGMALGGGLAPFNILFARSAINWIQIISLAGIALLLGALLARWLTWVAMATAKPQPENDTH